MSATSSPRQWKRSDNRSEVLTAARQARMSQPQEQQDQVGPHSHIVQQRDFNSITAQLDSLSELNSYDIPFDYPTNKSYTTSETVADSEDISRSSIEPPTLDYGLEPTNFPVPNLRDGFILDMDFDPLSSYNYNATEQESQKLLSLAACLTSHDNQLISPQLTDTASPESSFDGPASPMERVRLLGGGPMSRISSQSTSTDLQVSLCQNTPALTGCSTEASPEPVANPNKYHTENSIPTSKREYGPASSASSLNPELAVQASHSTHANRPIVRVEKYSRGDSPARTEGSAKGKMGKRSRSTRSTSHLAAPSDLSSMDGAEYDDHGDISHDTRPGLDPVARTEISDTIPNFGDQESIARSNVVKDEVEEWLTKVSPADPSINRPVVFRRRARSTGDSLVHALAGVDTPSISGQLLAEANARIPGPGLYIQEDSGDEVGEGMLSQDEESASEGAATSASRISNFESSIIENTLNDLGGSPWEDPIHLPSISSQSQPPTSQIAMTQFLRKAADIETASRKATWGTTVRRMSETDLEKLLGPEGLLSRLSVGRDKIMEIVDRRGSMLASRLLPKRTTSTSKNRQSEAPNQDFETTSTAGPLEVLQSRKNSLHARKESYAERSEFGSRPSTSSVRRMASNGRSKSSKSPKIDTGGAVAAIASQVAVIGANGSISPTATSSPTRGWNPARSMMRRKSRSESNRPVTETNGLGLAALWTQQGGPPLPTLASPPQEQDIAAPFSSTGSATNADSGDVKKEQTVTIDFTPQLEGIIPTKEGFKIYIQSVNPRILPFLAERLAREQLVRYKKLVKHKIEHAEAVRMGNCPSGKFCTQLGGQPSYPPSKVIKKDVEFSHTGFSHTITSSAEDDCDASSEGLVVVSQFPDGVPMPPVVRLPAEFECPLCFTVKKIQKPSDWSKHVHEDLQPFTCTFADCNEPKPRSFKRKADWVRHENERHRQLEWWTCNKPDCQHKCYRRDNFVQHLVREHKLADPNSKPARSNKPAVRGPGKKTKVNNGIDGSPYDDEVQSMVTQCRSDTTSQPQSEVCRLCGNICNSWKKLTVHLAKHMEQISIPVLTLVKEREVSPETIISPIDQQQSRAASALRAQDTELTQEETATYIKPNTSLDSPLPDHSPPFHGDRHDVYRGAQILPSSSTRMHATGHFFAPSRFDVRNTFWPESNQHATIQGPTSGLELNRSGNGAFVPLYSTGEQHEQPGFTPVNMLPTSSTAFHTSTSYSSPTSPMTGGRPMPFAGNSGFIGSAQHFQQQELAYHSQFDQTHFSSSEAQAARQGAGLIPQYRSTSSTPFQQPLNFDPSTSPQVQHFYPYST